MMLSESGIHFPHDLTLRWNSGILFHGSHQGAKTQVLTFMMLSESGIHL